MLRLCHQKLFPKLRRQNVIRLRALSTTSGPSETTTVILQNLPPTASHDSLKSLLSDIDGFRNVELEPGCSIHVSEEAAAFHAKQLLEEKLGLEVNIMSTSMPCLVLRNLPNAVASSALRRSFQHLDPRYFRVIAGLTVQVKVDDAKDALAVSQVVQTMSFTDENPTCFTVKLPDERFVVNVSNFPASVTAKVAETAISEAIRSSTSIAHTLEVTDIPSPTVARLRFNDKMPPADRVVINEALKNLTVDGKPVGVTNCIELKKPVVVVRKIDHVSDTAMAKLLEEFKPERVQLIRRSPDVNAYMAVVYFRSENEATAAMKKMHGKKVLNKSIWAGYREVPEPAVMVTGVPPTHFSETEILGLFKLYGASRVDLLDALKGIARVVVATPSDVALACSGNVKIDASTRKLLITPDDIRDAGFEVTLPEGLQDPYSKLREALVAAKVEPKSFVIKTNISARVGFLTSQQALLARQSFLDGSIGIFKGTPIDEGVGLVTAGISTCPSFALEVRGLDAKAPVSHVLDAIGVQESYGVRFKTGFRSPRHVKTISDGEDASSVNFLASVPSIDVLSINRSGIVKFKRRKNVLPALWKINRRRIDGQKLEGRAYRAGVLSDGGEYDKDQVEGSKEDIISEEGFDHMALRWLMKDYMHTDPATRYQLAKTHFEIGLAHAKGLKDVNYILGPKASESVRKEVEGLIGKLSDKTKDDPAVISRLFDLFLQRADMASFVEDFKDFQSFFGEADESDPFNWTQMGLDIEDDVAKLQAALKALDEKKAENSSAKAKQKKDRGALTNSDDDAAVDKDAEVDVGQEGGRISFEAQERKREEMAKLIDPEGRVWSGIILNNDTTQKITPAGRVQSFRCLVAIGNLKGTAGIGMGKAKTAEACLNAAFRDALHNLVHIDLYDNFGLAHDVMGKHNSCRAYIRATPRDRPMIASEFSASILELFGIGSASVKVTGRRDPYAHVKAIFNAVSKHVNLDEIARARGKQYLTLKWLHENNV